jgi:hypothetical protein
VLLPGAGVPVTALASNLLRSNTTQLAVGLQHGSVLLLEVAHENTRCADLHVCMAQLQHLPDIPAQRLHLQVFVLFFLFYFFSSLARKSCN